jgi:4a-hydroxytetrahydrobiopterin dehydratase
MEGLVPQKRFLAGITKEITMELAQMKCITYKAGSPPLIRKETMDLLGQVPGWSLQGGHLTRTFAFPDAATCIAFITEIAGFSAGEGHFPDICMKEGRFVDVLFYTYPAGGLTLNDFIMAAKLNEMGKTQ